MTYRQANCLCPRCESDRFFREERKGFLQSKLFPLLGLYPWECKVCRLSCMRLRRQQPLASGSRGIEVG
jgi:hypothetical protein